MSGIGMGILFDGYRVVSSELKFPRWTLSLLDLAYWIVSAILVFRMLYVSNSGEVRAYVFIGLAAGALLYYWLFSHFTTALTKWMIKAVKRLIAVVKHVFHFMFIKPLLLLWAVLTFFIQLGTKITIGIGKFVLQLIRPIFKLLFWLSSPVLRPIGRWLSPIWMSIKENDRLRHLWQTAKQKLWSLLRRK